MQSFYSVYVTPDQEVTITFQSRHFRFKYLVGAVVGVVFLAVAAVAVMALLRAGG
jgi:hypothetical protein